MIGEGPKVKRYPYIVLKRIIKRSGQSKRHSGQVSRTKRQSSEGKDKWHGLKGEVCPGGSAPREKQAGLLPWKGEQN